MASDDLETRKAALEDLIDSLSSWMIGFTWPVAVGLLMEFYAIFNPVWTREWNVIIDRIGLLLVTAGVSGELAVEHKTHRAERRLRRVLAEIEAGLDIALKATEARAAEANQKAQEAQLALAKFRASRVMTPDQMNAAVERLKPFAGTEYDFGLQSNDVEIMKCRLFIHLTLERAGWKAVEWAAPVMTIQPTQGPSAGVGFSIANVIVGVDPWQLGEKSAKAARALVDELKGVDGMENTAFAPMAGPHTSTNKKAVHIFIGRKS